MAYPNYGYGTPQAGYGASTGAYGYGEDQGTYNPRYHYAAALQHGFDVGGPEESMPRTLYVGNLHPSITEEFLTTLFGQMGVITKVKIIYDGASDPYAFIEFADHYTATQAITAMHKRVLLEREMKVNWATQPTSLQQKVDTSKHYHVFVGDLSPEVDNKGLKEAFQPFGEVSDAKVIRDPQTLKSKGYGFCSFPKREEAERAIEQMNGQWLGRRTIRTNWATRKPNAMGTLESYGGPSGYTAPVSKPSYDEVYSMTGPDNSSVYVGGMPPTASEEDIRSHFKQYGSIVDIRHFRAQGYAFVRFASKDAAAKAIVEQNGEPMMGQTVRCSWGKTDYVLKGMNAGGFRQPSPYGMGAGAGMGMGAGMGAGGAMAGAFAANPAAAAAANAQQQYWNYYQQYQQQQQYYGGGAGTGGNQHY